MGHYVTVVTFSWSTDEFNSPLCGEGREYMVSQICTFPAQQKNNQHIDEKAHLEDYYNDNLPWNM